MTHLRPKYVNANLNDRIRVRLTEAGLAEYQRRHDEICKVYGTKIRYVPPARDADGWSSFQMHNFADVFGSMLSSGLSLPCELDVQIQVGWEPVTEQQIEAEQAAAEAWGDGP